MKMPAESPEIVGQIQQLKRIVLSVSDFKHARRVADHILETDLHSGYERTDNLLLPALNCSMIISYCRPFSGNKGGAVPDLPGRFLRLLDSEERIVHDAAIFDRNMLLAHSDAAAAELELKCLRFPFGNLVVPVRSRGMDPLKREATCILRRAIGKLEGAVLEDRVRLDEILKPYLQEVDPERLFD